MNRREFLITVAAGMVSAAPGRRGGAAVAGQAQRNPQRGKTKIFLVRTSERATGIKRAVDLLGINPVKGQDVLLKPNFNTADQFPGSTHNDTLTHLILHLQSRGAKSITLGERGGPPDTADVLKEKGICDLCKKLGVGFINFELIPAHSPSRREASGGG